MTDKPLIIAAFTASVSVLMSVFAMANETQATFSGYSYSFKSSADSLLGLRQAQAIYQHKNGIDYNVKGDIFINNAGTVSSQDNCINCSKLYNYINNSNGGAVNNSIQLKQESGSNNSQENRTND